jgi:hypothetical protein
MHGCICPFAIDTRISASNTACDRNSPIKMRQINPQKSIIERIPTDATASVSPLDYRQNVKLFEKVYEGSIL